MSRNEHWNQVFTRRAPGEMTWYQEHLSTSLRFIEQTRLPKSAGILDVGGGASTLAEDLLGRGFVDVTVLDCSAAALDAARSRMGERAEQVHWLEADVLSEDLPASRFDLWHDRAAFHFLTESTEREAYRASIERTMRPAAHLILATFALTGPERCSRLPVVRYDAGALQQELGPGFHLIASDEEAHRTPSGNQQDFLYCHFQKN